MPKRWPARVAASRAAIAVMALGFVPARTAFLHRQANLGEVDQELTRDPVDGDVIVVSSWYEAITVDHDYHGPATLLSLPPIDAGTIDPALLSTREALETGHHVGIVGGLVVLSGWK